MILTDEHGRPFERPVPPPDGASLDDKVAYMRRLWAYNDAVSDCANRAFDETFRREVM